MLVVNSPKDRGLGADGVALDADAPLVLPEAITFKSLLADRNFWLIALVMSLLFSAYTGVLSNLVPLALNKTERRAGCIFDFYSCGGRYRRQDWLWYDSRSR